MIHQEAACSGRNQTELELRPKKDLMRLNYLKHLPILLPKVGTSKHGGWRGESKQGDHLPDPSREVKVKHPQYAPNMSLAHLLSEPRILGCELLRGKKCV